MLGLGLDISKSAHKSKVLVKDGFNRANSTTTLGKAETGQDYTIHGTAKWGINTNRAYLATQDSNVYNAAVIDVGKANVSIKTDVIYITNTAGGLCFRETNDTNFIQAVIGSTGLALRKLINSTYTDLGSYAFTPVNNTSYELKVIANENSITVYLDGTSRIEATEEFNNTATIHGLRVTTSGIYMDNLLMEVV